ncbi:MAG TPA: oxidoreductase, partial [Sphingobacteriaceae bacterium]|nr:oxidoreductase [Sphingobacteriaceae bacterium]
MNLLSILIFLPLLAGLFILFLPSAWQERFKYITLGVTAVQVLITAYIYLTFNSSQAFSGVHA